MYEPSLFTWILIVFGIVTCVPLVAAQIIILVNPRGKRARDILIGKDEEWRNETHFKSAYGLAWADWIIFVPNFIGGIIGIILCEEWGYLLFSISGAIQFYVNTFLFFLEKKYVCPKLGAFKYYTYYWGNFMYWGFTAFLYGILRIIGPEI